MSVWRTGSLAAALLVFLNAPAVTQERAPKDLPKGKTVQPPPPTRPLSEVVADLESPTATTRAAAARELAGATQPSDDLRRALVRLGRDDPDRAVRLSVLRTNIFLEALHGPPPAAREDGPKGYDEPPKPARTPGPKYPGEAFKRRISGVVFVLLLIDEQGDIEDAEVLRSIPALDDAALETAQAWKFEPAKKNGEPWATYAVAPINFWITSSRRYTTP